MKGLVFSRYAFSVCGVAILLAGCGMRGGETGVVPPMAREAALPHHHTFVFTGHSQTFIVPAHVARITVVALGAAGGGPIGPSTGRGGRVSAIIRVTPGEKLFVFVGGQGSYMLGGFNGGAHGGAGGSGYPPAYGGGGASDVRKGDDLLKHRMLVVGGGGGQGAASTSNISGGAGGDGGGFTGEHGGKGSGTPAGIGGGGGTQKKGGAGGPGGYGSIVHGSSGANGSLLVGGAGGSCIGSPSCIPAAGGGGGGGGYYGGGGGGQGGAYDLYSGGGGGGGGGSSYAGPDTLDFHSWQGWYKATRSGLVVFSWK